MCESGNLTIYTGADAFGCPLKEAILSHLKASHPSIHVIDLGVDAYYTIASKVGRHVSTSKTPTRGLLSCGTGVGVAIFANKHPGVYAATCRSVEDAVNARSINDCNVLCLSGMSTPASEAAKVVDAWLETEFKAACPASEGKSWEKDVGDFLDKSVTEMRKVPLENSGCSICCLRKNLEFQKVDIMPGAEMKIVRESPTCAIVKFKAGSVEPAHHHAFGHDVTVIKGKKRVWNLNEKKSYDLEEGDYLYTPSGDVHRVKYFEDTEFFIRWDGDWDIVLDEDLAVANMAIDEELKWDIK